MAKKRIDSKSDFSLSPAPEDIAIASGNPAADAAMSGEKRKAEPIGKKTKRAKETPMHAPKKPMDANASIRLKNHATETAISADKAIEVTDHAKANAVAQVTARKTSRRQTKSVKPTEPLQKRTENTKLRIGAHVSSAGGVHNALVNLVFLGGNAFALFLKNQKRWETPDLSPEHAELFIQGCREHDINAAECCLPHGSYLVNLAHPDPERKKQAYGSFLNDLTRCHKLGIRLYNFHPGNANATSREEGIRLIAESLNRAHQDPATGDVITLLETMASQGNTIGGSFADIGAIIALVKNQDRVGVCLDTCHVFAAGYDLRTPEKYATTMEEFDKEIGFKYLKAFHINDSKAPLASHLDLHARIGTGYLGLRAFHNLMNDERFHGLPMVLETPVNVVGEDGKETEDKRIWAREIKMLEKLVGMDVEAEKFKELEAKLQDEGKSERKRIGDRVERSNSKKAALKKKEPKEDGSEDEVS